MGRRARSQATFALVALVAAVALACGTGDRGAEQVGSADRLPSTVGDADVVAAASRRLAGPLLGQVVASGPTNVVISPWLAAEQLAVLRTGSGGTSRTALDAVLGTEGVEDEALLVSVGALADALEARTGEQRSDVRKGSVALWPAEALWLQRGTTLDEGWLDDLAAGTGRGVRTVDFRSDPEGGRAAVNRWAEDETRGEIDQLVPRGTVTADTRVLAASTLWFQAPWDAPFPPSATVDAPFALADGTTVDVATMRLDPGRLRWTEVDDLTVVELPYLGRALRLVVLAPADGRLEQAVAALADDRLEALLGDLRTSSVALALPRFAFTTTTDLAGPYGELGLGALFLPDEADLTGLAPTEVLAVSDAVQQAFASIDEEGTQTSAATVEEERAPTRPGTDRVAVQAPFAFVVLDGRTQAVVLAGAVGDPRA